MSPSIADLLERTNRERAGTDARVHRRVGEHLKRTGAALESLAKKPLIALVRQWLREH